MLSVDGTPVDVERYPNGEIRLGSVSSGSHVLWCFEGDQEIWQLFLLSRHLQASDVHLTIAYMPYSRMDRAPHGEVFTLKHMCRLINEMHFARVTVVEPHSDVTLALLDNAEAEYPTKSFISYCANATRSTFLVFPDAGAEKRYADVEATNRVVGVKYRDFDTGKITGLHLYQDGVMLGEKARKGQNALIVDDLCSYGGTFVRTAQELRYIGFEGVSLLVAHLEDAAYKGDLLNHVDNVWAFDTMQVESRDPKVRIIRRYRPE